LNFLFKRQTSLIKLIISFFLGIISFFVSYSSSNREEIFSVVVGWSVFASSYIIMSLLVIFKLNPEQIKKRCEEEDIKVWIIFILVFCGIVLSISAVLNLIIHQKEWTFGKPIGSFVYIYGVTCSWLLMHIIFTFRYAHLFYAGNKYKSGQNHGIKFPSDNSPDYMDFAYLSFVIGMTYQVSDNSILSKEIRRLVLIHSIVSFVFNTVIIALTINEILSLSQR